MVAASASAEAVVDKEFNLAGLSNLPGWASDDTKPKLSCSADGLVVNNPEETTNFWDLQFIIGSGLNIVEGTEYTVTAVIKTSATGNIHLAFGDWASKPFESDFVVEKGSSDWQTLTYKATASASMQDAFGLMQSGKFVGEYIVKSVTVSHEESGDTPGTEPGEATKTILKSFYDGNGGTLGGWNAPATFVDVEEDGKPCICVTVPEELPETWSAQMAFNYDFEPGVTYYMDFEVKGTVAGTITSGLQNSDTYAGGGNFTDFKITTEWAKQTISCTATAAGDGLPNRWTANFGKYVGSAWFTNVVLYTLKTGAVEAVAVPVQVNTGVYNLQGVKVANSLEEVTVPGLYITNGKKVIKK